MAKRLSLMMGLATLTLPFYHAAAYGQSALFLWVHLYRPVTVPNYDQIGTLGYYGTFAVRQLSAPGIPIFLFVAGFFVAFMAKGSAGGPDWSAVIKRIQKLLIPYVIWMTITTVLLQRVPSVSELLMLYYFIPLLAQYYLLSPLIVQIARVNWQWLLIGTAIIQFGLYSLRYLDDIGASFTGMQAIIQLTPLWLFPSRIFYFSLGVVAGLHLEVFRNRLYRIRWQLLLIVIIAAAMTLVEHNLLSKLFDKPWLGPTFSGISRAIYGVAVVIFFLALKEIRGPFTDPLTRLGRMSLGVFLVNTPVIFVASGLIYHLAPWIFSSQLLYQGILVIFGLGVPLLLMWTVSRSPVRKYYTYVFG